MEQTENSRQETTIEESLKELDDIVEKLESREISLEESFTMYQKGMELLKQCSGKIDKVEKKKNRESGAGHREISSCSRGFFKKSHKGHELQHGGRGEAAQAYFPGRDVSGLRRRGRTGRTFYGSN